MKINTNPAYESDDSDTRPAPAEAVTSAPVGVDGGDAHAATDSITAGADTSGSSDASRPAADPEAAQPDPTARDRWQRVRQEAGGQPHLKNFPTILLPPRTEEAARPQAEPPRIGRFALLAASIALAAAIGAAVGGVVGGAGLAGARHATAEPPRKPPAPALQRADIAEETKALKESIAQLRGGIRSLTDSVTNLRGNLDASSKASGTQIAKLNEQVGKLHESVERIGRAQGDQSARVAKSVDAIDRRPAAAPVPARPDITSSIPTPAPRPPEAPVAKSPLVDGWNLRAVYDGVAVLEGPDRVIEVEPGDAIRGVGRVQDIRRQDGRWVVVTNRGLIVSR